MKIFKYNIWRCDSSETVKILHWVIYCNCLCPLGLDSSIITPFVDKMI